MIHFRRICLTFFAVSWSCFLYGQNTTIEGTVKADGSNEPLPYAHIFFKTLQAGTTSDSIGHFKLTVKKALKVDTLIISFLGYYTEKMAIAPGEDIKIEAVLKPQFTQLQEVFVEAGENPAWAILDKVIDNKKNNDPASRSNYFCEEYSKIRFDLNHFTEKIKQNIMLRPFDFIWEGVDTTSDGVTYLPVLLVEKVIDHYYQQSPAEQRDIVQGVNTTGLKGPKIMGFVEDLYLTPNIYDNFVIILDKSFPSPINDNYKNHYNHYLLDSVMVDGSKFYQISFYPKHKRELSFTGEMLIDASSYAIKHVELRFDIMANVNFVRSYLVSLKYEKVDQQYWMPSESQVIGDFTVVENSSEMTGFFGRKNSTYRKYLVDKPLMKSIFRGIEKVVQADSATEHNVNYWEEVRHVELTKEENRVFDMVKKIEKDPAFILRKNLLVALVTGYIPAGNIDIGNFYTFYSYNIIEHSRLKFGFKSGDDLKFPIRFSTYGAYGTFDEKWKYGITSDWGFGKRKTRKHLGASYKYDIEQLGRSFNQLEIDNILTSFVQYGGVASRNYVSNFSAYVDNNWTTGLLTRLTYFNNTISPTKDEYYYLQSEAGLTTAPHYNANGLGVTVKFTYQKNDLDGKFYTKDDSKIIYRKFPDVALEWRWADKNTFNSQVHFIKYNILLRQNIRLQKLGYLQYYIEAGRTLGTVPYPYLNIPFGNQLVFQDDYAFNLMNFLEYASDKFASVYVQHHFGGLILDRIPGVNKLKWRNFIFARAYWGSLSDKNNQSIYLFPSELRPANTNGYYEVGFGIENIFKIARVDFTWRLTDTDAPNVYRFIVKPSFKLSF
jgi:hypothetical protein